MASESQHRADGFTVTDPPGRVLPDDHPLRHQLGYEVHARPFAELHPPECIMHLALCTGEAGAGEDRAQLAALCRHFGADPPREDQSHQMFDFGAIRLKWERHTEFCTYTLFRAGPPGDDPFSRSLLAYLPEKWLSALAGDLLAAVSVVIERPNAHNQSLDQVAAMMSSQNFAGAEVSGGAAQAFMDFSIDRQGFGRAYVRDSGLKPRQAGRLVQRLLEIETYRMMALLGLPIARESGTKLSAAEARLKDVMTKMTSPDMVDDESRLLGEITGVAAEVEGISSQAQYRFAAGRAYYGLVQHRIGDLREKRIEGLQTFTEFVDRRLAPAMRTCDASSDRIDDLSRRLARAAQLLCTRVNTKLESQHKDLLASMDRRSGLQLRLQETVEGLSVAAITYYSVSLINYAAGAVRDAGVDLPVATITGMSIPVVAVGVWYVVRRVRKHIEHKAANGLG